MHFGLREEAVLRFRGISRQFVHAISASSFALIVFFGAVALVTTVTSSARASLLEIRGFAGLTFTAPKDVNDRLTSSGIKTFFVVGNYGGDVVLRLPGSHFGLGARYDWQGIKMDATYTGAVGNEFEVGVARTSALLSYRFVDKRGYVGLNGTYGVTHKPSIRIKESGTVSQYDSAGNAQSMSIGAEGGVHFAAFMLGGEIGYQNYVVNDLNGPNGMATFNVVLSGFYGFVHFGLGF